MADYPNGDLIERARMPENEEDPNEPKTTVPLRLSPWTIPENSSVIGIGLVMDTFQEIVSPFTLPSKMSAEFPSASWLPLSTAPSVLTDRVAGRSPMGVDMTRFQFPSALMMISRN
jgi:hypothetical protein